MQFEKPTTKEGMYVVLSEIFHYYRIKRMDYEGVQLEELALERMENEDPTEEEITAKAETLLGVEKEKTLFEYKNNLTDKIAELELKIIENNSVFTEREEKIRSAHSEALKKYRTAYRKNGITDSGLFADKTLGLDKETEREIKDLKAEKGKEEARLKALIKTYGKALNEAESRFETLFEKKLNAKVQELKDEISENRKERFKYNNGLQEKEIRYANSLMQINANLELKYIQIKASELSKDELIEMGYYQDVLNCVAGYYDSLQPSTAYSDIKQETKLIVYLDDYYQDLLYRYKLKAE